MESTTNSWRDKYLGLSEEHEQLLSKFESQQELMRRALVRVSLAAEGQYESLDQSLQYLRQQLKEGKSLQSAVDQLESVLLETESQSRSSSSNRAQIPDHKGKPGILQRMFGGRNSSNQEPELSDSQSTTEQNQEPEMIVEPPVEAAQLEGELLASEDENVVEVDSEAVFERPVFEPAFSRVSDKVESVLADLIEKVEPVACTEVKAAEAKKRLQKGLNWYELVPTLEDIRDMVVQAYLFADEEYREYLHEMHDMLSDIIGPVGEVTQDLKQQQTAEEQFQQTLQMHLGSLSQSAEVATEVTVLKQGIEKHLQSIQDALAARIKTGSGEDIGNSLLELNKRLAEAEQAASEAQRQLQEQAEKALLDSLTGLPNREAYNQRAYQEWCRWQRYKRPLTLVVCDIDHFKRVNDTFGHQAGDRVIKVLTKAMSQRLRQVDFMARYGGEEFVILLPETDVTTAFSLMDKVRAVIADTPFRFKQEPVAVTVSMGLAGLEEGSSIEEVFAMADKRLYQAKQTGRNRCQGP